ncbi:sugar transferase [Spirosoma sp. KNUC1025]|uniref:sugar transferase n=1 Tax=Spirosoma sp. KNUC1025 TaxID=2894082 RepID=UPI00386D33BD|nr:sugar transferase [Spirosoma sp. KNUC1025]
MLDLSLPSYNDTVVSEESYWSTVEKRATLSRYHRLVKRLFDLIVSGLAMLLILSWLFPIIGLIICFSSPGPILFVQLRTGRNGRQFRCLKFRTMTYQLHASFQQATKNDTRITPIGKFLRKTNLDELPQIINVFLGDMSIVGPRPHPIQLDAQHWLTTPGYPERYAVKPGITGIAQVRGCRGETTQLFQMEHRLRYDKLYITKQTVVLDAKICFWTAQKMIQGDENAY